MRTRSASRNRRLAPRVVRAVRLDRQFAQVAALVRTTRERVYHEANSRLLDLYWRLGEYISRKIEAAVWGEGTVDALADYLGRAFPDMAGLERRNLYRMRQFYEAYRHDQIVSAVRTQLSWTSHRLILSKASGPEERQFYVRLCAQERYSTRELERQMASGLFQRVALSKTTRSRKALASASCASHAVEAFRDSYVLNFLGLPADHSETDLRTGIRSVASTVSGLSGKGLRRQPARRSSSAPTGYDR